MSSLKLNEPSLASRGILGSVASQTEDLETHLHNLVTELTSPERR